MCALASASQLNVSIKIDSFFLKGNTPAETDGIEVKGKNKWLGLMQESHNNI